MPVAICDSPVLIYLAKLGDLHLLTELFDGLAVPQAVHDECVAQGRLRGFPDAEVIDGFLQANALPLAETSLGPESQVETECALGPGERACLRLAEHTPGVVLILDDELAREAARDRGFAVKGTVGIILDARRWGHLSSGQARQYFRQLRERKDIWISARLLGEAERRLR